MNSIKFMSSIKFLKRFFISVMVVVSIFGVTGCGGGNGFSGEADFSGNSGADFVQISAEEAKEIMDSGSKFFLIDSRTEGEFSEGHIEGAVLIPEYEIATSISKLPAEKDALILVYCRSGRRSKIASKELVKLGYTNVKEFGGIIDWPYEVVK